jgi:hypothetical protein
MKMIWIVLLLTACSSAPPAVQQVGDRQYTVVGRLDKMEYDSIIDIINHNPGLPITFYATSHGGSSAHLFDAMEAVHKHGQVHWYSLNYCESACAIMALSTRHAHGDFKIHSFYRKNHNHLELASDFNEKVLGMLGSYGYDCNRLNHMFSSAEVLWNVHMEDEVLSEE